LKLVAQYHDSAIGLELWNALGRLQFMKYIKDPNTNYSCRDSHCQTSKSY